MMRIKPFEIEVSGTTIEEQEAALETFIKALMSKQQMILMTMPIAVNEGRIKLLVTSVKGPVLS